MAVFTTPPNRPVATGYTVGMLCAEWNVPFVPGDLNYAATFDFPVRYLTVDGASGAEVLTGAAEDYAHLFVAAAQRLEAEGVRAITGNCGYMAVYQEIVADAVSIPVFMSSLVQAPMLLQMLGSTQRLGTLVANASGITEAVLTRAGIRDTDRLVVRGLDTCPHFHDAIIKEVGVMDEDLMREEVVESAVALVDSAPDVGAILLECSDLPPYARAVQEATGLPVFDWAGFIRYVHQGCAPLTYRPL
jgi:hypothetical protein